MNKIMVMTDRLDILDSLKGLAIVAVVLYHLGGGASYGYLGVDIFFVVGGYFFLRSLLGEFENNKFKYCRFIFRKIMRLWPLVLIAGAVSLLGGFFTMLPDDYENLSESVIASSFFLNNILQCITTRNYWNVVNKYKPLMHTWYVSVLMQSYVMLPAIYLVFIRVCKNVHRGVLVCTSVVSIISIGLYLLPVFSSEWKFYCLSFRVFEITLGGLPLFIDRKFSEKNKKLISFVSLIALVGMLCAKSKVISQNVMHLITVVATVLFIYFAKKEYYDIGLGRKIQKVLSVIGKRSYSIYIWHQIVIAFLFYSVFRQKSLQSFVTSIFIICLLSVLSYQYIEKPLGNMIPSKRNELFIILGSIAIFLIICSISFKVYLNAGVVRDVPELNINVGNVHRHMHAEYCDRPYQWDHDFVEDHKIHILVLGNSFGRDWANILYEWDSDNAIEISYSFYPDENFSTKYGRIDEADYVFYAEGPGYDSVPEEIVMYVPKEKLYIIGNKNYGECNGIVYAKRHAKNYFNQSVKVPVELSEQNSQEKNIYGNHYIDMLEPVQRPDETICVFTDDHKFISQDCMHLTKAGAQYYARLLKNKVLVGKWVKTFSY